MPSRKELVAHGRTDEQIACEIGADVVIFQELNNLVKCVSEFNDKIVGFDVSVFSGSYITR
jgi:amidophosphoribosyltransferase